MPIPRAGDIVLYSTDRQNFANATIGFVYKRPGGTTIDILVFTPSGWVDRRSVHHKDDPGWLESKHWGADGAWELAQITQDIQRAVDVLGAWQDAEEEKPVKGIKNVNGK
jgi:hypothetical protein